MFAVVVNCKKKGYAVALRGRKFEGSKRFIGR